MNISLGTIDVWAISEGFTVGSLLSSLSIVVSSADVLVIGSYVTPPAAALWLTNNTMHADFLDKPFDDDNFYLNRVKYPQGRSYRIPASPAILLELAKTVTECLTENNDCFIDHLLAYRTGTPTVPLLDFHDASIGGTLTLSGLYNDATVLSFAASLQCEATRVLNPEIEFMAPKTEGSAPSDIP